MKLSIDPIHILIIQNNDADMTLLKKILQNTDVPVSQISDVRDLAAAVKCLKTITPDIIFLDLQLPDRTGIKTFLNVQLHSRQVPIVILTNEDDTSLALKAINQGAQDFLIIHDVDERLLTKTILYSIERKRISESLQLSNERYNLVSRATNDMVWDWDLQKNRVYRNRDGWNRLFATPSSNDSSLADSWLERVHPDDRDKTDQQIDNILHNKDVENFEIECRMIKHDGSYAYVIDRGYAIRNEQGEVTRMVGVTQNITEQKLAEEKLKASEERFRSIIERSNEGLILINGEGQLLDASPAAKNILGFSGNANELIINISQVHPEDVLYVQTAYDEIMREKNTVKIIEYRYKKISGSYIWIEATFHNLLHEPAIQAVVVHFRDISSRKIFEDILKDSEEKYRRLFNVNPSSIIISDPSNFSIKEVNDAAVKEFGYNREEILQMRTIDIIPSKDENKVKEFAEIMKNNIQFLAHNIWEVRVKNGKIIYMDAVTQAIDYYGIKANLTIANNITEKLDLEQKLSQERLQNQQDITKAVIIAQEKEREILGKELHDNINQILVTTKLYIEHAMANEEGRNKLLETSKGFITTAISELRNLSKSLLPPSLGEVGLIMALDELTESIHRVNKFSLFTDWKDLEEKSLSDGLKLTIFRIVQEQLSNIIKHADAKNVWIKIKIKNKRLVLEVIDDGVGFDLANRNAGVGFKNIKSRAELHNGTKVLKSKKGEGCTLTVRFNL